jgi:DNA-binding CsgD family transcriptional regulator
MTVGPDPRDDPSPIELRVYRTYLEMGRVRDTADRLGMPESTARNHLANLRSKLHVKNNAQIMLALLDRLAA